MARDSVGRQLKGGRNRGGASDGNEHRAIAAASPSSELLALAQAAEAAFSKLMALFVAYASTERVHPANANPKEWMSEAEVAKMTRLSRIWFLRAREEGIGPHYDKIASRVRYLRADVERWIQSGEAARARLTSRPPKKGKKNSRPSPKGTAETSPGANEPREAASDDDR